MKTMRLLALFAVLMLVFGCGGGDQKEGETAQEMPAGDESAQATPAADEAAATPEPDYITVQHILIGFEGSVPGKEITRTQGEAGVLATELFERAKGGEDFDALVKEYTDDAHPGIYKMANTGAEADMASQVFPRQGMVPAFGDVGFVLEVGEIGLATYDPNTSPYGWHIIKRVE
jgi:hypothetical protein